jgi:excisionase family DNA binding protein
MVMTVMEAAERIGISSSLVYELCRLGMIRHSRHGRPGKRGTIRISEDAVTNYLAPCEREPALIPAPTLCRPAVVY